MNSIRSITEIVPDDIPTLTPLPEPSSDYGGFLDFSWKTWIIIILILALLGINVFAYLAKGTQETAGIIQQVFGPIFAFFGYQTLEVTKQTIETGATGATAGINAVADTAVDTITAVQGDGSSSTASYERVQEPRVQQKDNLNKALNDAQANTDEGVIPDDSRSSIQTIGKSGWCYIGEDQGVRSCTEIGVNDTCMSGDVYPTQAVCMNPKLRA
jgi:hypothetical protein